MIRKQVYLTTALEKQLKAEAKRRGVPEAAVIRERLAHKCDSLRPNDEEARKRFIRTLRKAEREAIAYVGRGSGWKFKREEAYEERLEQQMPR